MRRTIHHPTRPPAQIMPPKIAERLKVAHHAVLTPVKVPVALTQTLNACSFPFVRIMPVRVPAGDAYRGTSLIVVARASGATIGSTQRAP
jgi:hypothetical protein